MIIRGLTARVARVARVAFVPLFALTALAALTACDLTTASTSTTTEQLSAPGIVQQPANVTVAAGQSASFTVIAAGSAPLTYQWSRNGVPIANATNASYTLLNSTKADSGVRFFVTVSNPLGSATSNAALLTVAP